MCRAIKSKRFCAPPCAHWVIINLVSSLNRNSVFCTTIAVSYSYSYANVHTCVWKYLYVYENTGVCGGLKTTNDRKLLRRVSSLHREKTLTILSRLACGLVNAMTRCSSRVRSPCSVIIQGSRSIMSIVNQVFAPVFALFISQALQKKKKCHSELQ